MDMESVLTAADLAAFGEEGAAMPGASPRPTGGSQAAEADAPGGPDAGETDCHTGAAAPVRNDGGGDDAAPDVGRGLAPGGPDAGETDCHTGAAAPVRNDGGGDDAALPEGLTAVPPEAVRAAAAAAAYRARAEDFAAERCRGWLDEAAAFGEREPDFDLAASLRAGGVFPCLLRYGLPLAEAWRAANVDAVARRAAERARIALADDIRARGLRPAEAGAAAVPAFAQREDVAGLSDAEVRAVLGRVERRERVSFG